MKIVFKSRILSDGMQMRPEWFYKEPFLTDDKIFYFFSAMDKTSEIPYDEYVKFAVTDKKSGKTEVFKHKCPKAAMTSADKWEIVQRGGSVRGGLFKIDTARYLTGSERYYSRELLNADKNGFSDCAEEPDGQLKKIYSDGKEYRFGGVKIAIAKKSVRKLECTDVSDGKVLWTFKFVGYLYTGIKLKDGIVYFGTAGQGGHFYGLDIKSGELVHDINTHGTVIFGFYKDKILFPSEYGDLHIYCPQSRSSEFFAVAEDGFINDETDFLIEENRLYLNAAERTRDGDILDFYTVCVDLDG